MPLPEIDSHAILTAIRDAARLAGIMGHRPCMLVVMNEDMSQVPIRIPLPVILGELADEIIKPAGKPAIPQCKQDIIATLKEVGHRLSTSELMGAMLERDMEWSDRTVKRYLLELMEEEVIDNDRTGEARGKGYGFVTWNATNEEDKSR